MIRKKPAPHLMRGGYRFSLATNAERVCAEIMLKQKIERNDDSKKSHHVLGRGDAPVLSNQPFDRITRGSEPRPCTSVRSNKPYLPAPAEIAFASSAARCMLEDISLVTVLCSSTAAAVDVTYSLTSWMALLIESSAVTTSPEMPFKLSISVSILSVACFAWLARLLTSDATTAKPRPASPARADSIVALSASRLIWPVMLPMISTMPLIACAASLRRLACESAEVTRSTAPRAVSLDFIIAAEISRTEVFSSSAPAATDSIMLRTRSLPIRTRTCLVTSLAYLTTLNGLPLRSRIGL